MVAGLLTAWLILGSGPAGTSPAPGWVEEFREDGVVVSSRVVAGRDLPRLRAKGTFNENMWEILAVLNDIPRHTEWMKNLSEQTTLTQRGPFDLLVYSRFASPWPMWDRDSIMRVAVDYRRHAQEVTIKFLRTESHLMPVLPGLVRVPRLEMLAHLRYRGPKRTDILFEVDIDPGGGLPRWIVRWISKKIPVRTLRRLRQQIEKTRGGYEEFLQKWDPAYPSGSR